MTRRQAGGLRQTFLYDAFDSKDLAKWTWSAYQTAPYNDGGNNVVKSTGTGVNWNANFYRNDSYSLANNEAVQLRFKVDNGSSQAIFAVETASGSYRRLQAIVNSNKLTVQYTLDGSNYYSAGDLLPSITTQTWYHLQIVIDDRSGFTLQAFKESDPGTRGFLRVGMPAGLSWRFHHWIYTGSAYIDDYYEFNGVGYFYDSGANGIGRRASMADTSGTTIWSYDARGRVTQETKTIGTDTFVTQWGYNAADMVSSMVYPANNTSGTGEAVSYAYNRQMALDAVTGYTNYVPDTLYNAAGQVELRKLGGTAGSPVLQTDYSYFGWGDLNGWGRLKRITTGTPGTPNSLQDLWYYSGTDTSKYDANGNLLNIYDYKAGGTQTQTFTYDNLDRLTSAYASGGTGGTYGSSGDPENYNYDTTTGNLWEVEGRYYTYDATQKHAVRRVSGSGGSSQSISIRAYSTPCQDGIGATMELWVNDSKVQTWTNVAGTWTTYSKSTPLSGKDKIDVAFTNDCTSGGYDRNLYVDYVTVAGTTIQAETGAALIDKGGGSAAFDGDNVIPGQQGIYWNGALRLVKGAGGYAAGYDANGNMTSRVVDGAAFILSYDAENRLTGVSGATTATYVYDGDGNRVKATAGGVTTVYVGNYFEWTGSTSTMVKYYYAGATRVALRIGAGTGTTGLSWLLSDHLGSTTITANSSGAKTGELRYKAWGETRHTWGTTPTKRQYTGQINDTYINIYWYESRWYDPALSRWIQPDVIIPDAAQGVQAWDRYAGMNNNPVRWNDPSGHFINLGLMLGGAVLSAAINYTIQTVDNIKSGMNFTQAISWSNIDKKSLIVATIGGAVGGLTMGLATPAVAAIGLTPGATILAEGIVGGAASNIAAGQAEAITSAALDQVSEYTTIEAGGVIHFQPNFNEFITDASAQGFGNRDQMIYDGVVGGTLGLLSGLGKMAINELGTPDPLRFGGQSPSWIRPAAQALEYGKEYWDQSADRRR